MAALSLQYLDYTYRSLLLANQNNYNTLSEIANLLFI